MRYLKVGMVGLFILITFLAINNTYFTYADERMTNMDPPENFEKKFRIGYVESDPFLDFAGTLNGIITGLEQLGWINDTTTLPYTPGQEDSKIIWNWLQNDHVSDYLDFVDDAYYNLRFMSEEEICNMLQRMKEGNDLDLVIVMGTRAGVIMSSIEHNTPFMVFSATDAVGAGIVKSAEDSGYDHIWAHMDPDHTKRQIRVFHDIFQFETMGIVYEDSPSGRSLVALNDILEVANERGIKVVERHVVAPKNELDYERYYHDLLMNHQQLAQEVDAMYLTYGDWEMEYLPKLIEPFIQERIPVFSQTGAEEVEKGVLISVSRADFDSWGKFGAENIVKALKGTSMKELPQILENTSGIALNLDTAKKIDYKIPFDILLVADEIYHSVGVGEE